MRAEVSTTATTGKPNTFSSFAFTVEDSPDTTRGSVQASSARNAPRDFVNPSRKRIVDDSDDDAADDGDGWIETSVTAAEKAANIQKAKQARIMKRPGAVAPKMVDTPMDVYTCKRVSGAGLEDTPDREFKSLDQHRAELAQKREKRELFKSDARSGRLNRRQDVLHKMTASSSSSNKKRKAVVLDLSDEESFEEDSDDSDEDSNDSDNSGDSNEDEDEDEVEESDNSPARPSHRSRAISNNVTVDLTNEGSSRHQRSTHRVFSSSTLASDGSDDDGWAYAQKGKTDVMSRAQKILRQCKLVSHNLRAALIQWSGGSVDNTADIKAPAGEEEGCTNITSIKIQTQQPAVASDAGAGAGANTAASDMQGLDEQEDVSAEAISEILTETHIHVKCPDLTLKDYQFVGVNWLKLLYQYNINGVLADDMGLGKTVQTVAFLGWIKSQQELRGKRVKRPHLIVVPASTLSNWLNEIQRFCPALTVLNYHGSQAERSEKRRYLRRHADEVDVIFSTYTIFERESGQDDRSFLYSQSFDYLILDEAHCIKNSASSRFYNLNKLNTKHRLLLSGTPVQNDVSELLALLSFLMPKVFAQQDCALLLEAFGWNASSTKEKGDHKSKATSLQIKQLRSMMAPFVLRRIKQDVLTQLVDKITVTKKVKMTERQTSVYENILLDYAAKKEKQRLLVLEQDEEINRLNIKKKSGSSNSISSLADAVVVAERRPRTAATAAVAAMSDQSKIFNSSSLSIGLNARKVTGSDVSGSPAKKAVASATAPPPMSSPVRVSSNGDLTLPDVDDTTMSGSEAKHLFTTLRKAANHPLLLRIRYTDEIVLDRIAQVAYNHQHFGQYCDVARVRQELNDFSDFDLHQLCAEYPKYLSSYMLPAEVLYDSPKMIQLKEMLPELIEQDHRVLIFSQWTRLLDLLEVLLNEMDLAFLRLDGSTPVSERQALIDVFNVSAIPESSGTVMKSKHDSRDVIELIGESDEESTTGVSSSISSLASASPTVAATTTTPVPSGATPRYNVNVFLLSTKAGGLGINLTSADTVILHDLDFNPENDRQAEDRCHRIGQTKPVTIYKLVTEDTVDMDIFTMGERKQVLSNAVLGDNRTKKQTKGGTASAGEIADTADDIGAIGRILQGALARLKPKPVVAAVATATVTACATTDNTVAGP